MLSSPPIHTGVNCDECGVKPIVGIRYKCGNCVDYDLCSYCVDNRRHEEKLGHIFLKLKKPIDTSRETAPLLSRVLYPNVNQSSEPQRPDSFGREEIVYFGQTQSKITPPEPLRFPSFQMKPQEKPLVSTLSVEQAQKQNLPFTFKVPTFTTPVDFYDTSRAELKKKEQESNAPCRYTGFSF